MSWFPLHGTANLSMGFLCLLFVSNLAAGTKEENKKEDRIAVLATAEVPAKSIDLAAINLTELVNGMLNTALKGTRKFFSLLSITSYSSYAFHKVSIVIYNISNLKNVDPSKFPMRYCYCLNNRTNDLTDFTALLVDIVENSTNYLKEIFKSTSIVSVSQSNDTDCIYICVMSGRTGRNLSDLWEVIEKSPVINYTFSGNVSNFLGLDLTASGLIPLREDPEKVWGDTSKDGWAPKATKKPTWVHAGTLKREEINLTQEPMTLKMVSLKTSEASSVQIPVWFQTNISRGDGISSTKSAATDPSPLLGSSPVRPLEIQPVPTPKMPLQTWSMFVKDKETTVPHFTIWRRTVGLKGSEESSFQIPLRLQTISPKEWKSTPNQQTVPLSPLSKGIPSDTKTVPTSGVTLPWTSLSKEDGQNVLKTHTTSSEIHTFLTQPIPSKITEAPWPTQIGNIPSPALPTPAQRPGVLQKVNSRCPQGIKKGFSASTPAATLQKINPCVMELCKFYQQCLCTRSRSYSRDYTMRYCLENYSWFLRNAIYICERVKRTAFSKTLKQKCLASICRSI